MLTPAGLPGRMTNEFLMAGEMPELASSLASAVRSRWRNFARAKYWLYILIITPFLTDLVETGALPSSLRGWTTELVVGAVLAMLVERLRRGHVDAVQLSRTDPLTGLGNRRAFDEAIESEWARAQRLGCPLTLVFIDLDNFKQVNDKFGHATGDAVLQHVAKAIRRAVRAKVDGGFRLGGDEFAVLLPASDADEAAAVIARIRARCASRPVRKTIGTELSAGVVELASDETLHAFLLRADAGMYQQKRLRRSSLK